MALNDGPDPPTPDDVRRAWRLRLRVELTVGDVEDLADAEAALAVAREKAEEMGELIMGAWRAAQERRSGCAEGS